MQETRRRAMVVYTADGARIRPSPSLSDVREDRAYREGYRQAWREWSDCCKNGPISENDRATMARRLASIEKR